jgi:hypothetical protein
MRAERCAATRSARRRGTATPRSSGRCRAAISHDAFEQVGRSRGGTRGHPRRFPDQNSPAWALAAPRSLDPRTGTTDLLEEDTIADMATAAAPLLDTETFSASSTRDALGRVLTAVSPDASEVHHPYDEGAGRQAVTLNHRGSVTSAPGR